MQDGFMQTAIGSGKLFMFMHHVDSGGPATYSEIGPQFSEAGRLGSIFGRDVWSTIESIDGPFYLFSPSAANCFIGYFRDLSDSFVLDVISGILAHGPILRDDFVNHQFVSIEIDASKLDSTFKQLLLMNINFHDDFSGQNITQSAGSSEECVLTPLFDIYNDAYDAITSDPTSAMTFTTVNSNMVLLFRMHTQCLSFNSSICFGYICSFMSKVTDVCTISVWVIVHYVLSRQHGVTT
jgi:hypothetical protein